MLINEFITKYKIIFEKECIEPSLIECKLILSNFFNINLNQLFFEKNREINDDDLKKLDLIIQERLTGKPISKIFKKKTFWQFDFFVDENVLDPRFDTERLVESILNKYDISEKLSIMDLGTGSGCILLTLLKMFKNSTGLGVDISEKALAIAKKNAVALNVDNRVNFKLNNWNDNINEKFDIILSNPPYIPSNEINFLSNTVKNFDPLIALDGGEDGLHCYRYIANNLKKNCNKNTKIFLEIGIEQKNDIIKIFEENGFKFKSSIDDYGRICRVLIFVL